MVKQSREIYLWMAPPYPDETVSSVLDRAASFHGLKRRQLAESLVPPKPWQTRLPDVDREARGEFSAAICLAMGYPANDPSLWPSEAPQDSLKPCARSAYCPFCFMEDLKSGRTPHFRWQWSHAFVTMCHIHETPLFNWRKVGQFSRTLPHEWTASPGVNGTNIYPWLLEDFDLAGSALDEFANDDSPLRALCNFQKQALVLGGGFELAHRNHAAIHWEGFSAAVRDSAAWRDSGTKVPLASKMRPRGRAGIYFSGVPDGARRVVPRNAFRHFYQQADVAWRRSVLWSAIRAI